MKLPLSLALLFALSINVGYGQSPARTEKIESFSRLAENSRVASRVTVPTIDGKTITMMVHAIEKTTHGSIITGSIQGSPGSHSRFVFEKDTLVEGEILLAGKNKAIHYAAGDNGKVTISERVLSQVCQEHQEHPSASDVASRQSAAPAESILSAYNIPLLESLPSSSYVVFLDFDGQYVKSSYWNGGIPIKALPSNATQNDIHVTWKVVSEDFSPFNVNVTTDSTVFHRAAKGKRVRCIFTPTGGWIGISWNAGVAIQNSFPVQSEDIPCWAFTAIGRTAGEIASHEIGHTFGLYHDGRAVPNQPTEEYFAGHNKWGAIMSGSFSTSMTTQWSKGEYRYANNTQDDIVVMAGAPNNFGFRADEAGSTIATAKTMILDANGSIGKENDGVISSRTDIDVFGFTTTGGKVMIDVSGAPIVLTPSGDSARISNLDIMLKLTDVNGNVLVTSDKVNSMTASLNETLPAGSYYLFIDGVGKLDPLTNGYSDYGSVGQYYIRGSILVGTNQSPIVNIVYPENHSYYAVGIMFHPFLEAKAVDPDGTIERVEFLSYDSLLTTVNASPYEVRWTYKKPGVYKITARAYDNNGAYTDSEPWYIEVVAPVVKITSPTVQAVYVEGTAITIAATARIHYRFSIPAVEFYDGTTLLGTVTTGPHTFNWTNASVGVHTVRVKALSNYNTATTTESVTITVVPAPPASFVTSSPSVCAGASGIAYSVPVVNGVTYHWEYSGSGMTITQGIGTAAIVVDFAPNATSGTLSVSTTKNGVNSPALDMSVDVSVLPSAPEEIIGNSAPTAGTAGVVYNVDAAEGHTYLWSYDGLNASLLQDGHLATLDFSATATPGTLSVVVKNTCGETEETALFIDVQPKVITAIEPAATPVSVYPNPSSGDIVFHAPALARECTVTIADLAGRIIFESNIRDGEKIDLSAISKGIYFLHVDKIAKPFTTKIVLK